jgi:hypothetical protein
MVKTYLTGDGAENYEGEALDLYKRLKALGFKGRKTTMVDNALIIITVGENDSAMVIMLVSEYAIFVGNPATTTFYALFLDTVPKAWPVFVKLLPAMPLFFPVYPDELMVPLYDRLNTFVSGNSSPYQSVMFLTPITSTHSEALLWQGLMMQPNLDTDNQMVFTLYNLEGYLNVNDLPIYTKMALVNAAGTVINEFDANAPIVHVVSERAISKLLQFGIFYRRLIVADGVEKVIVYFHDETTHSGALYEMIEDTGVLYAVPLSLPALANGSRLDPPTSPKGGPTAGSRRVDNMTDIFTSEKSAYYYVVKQTVDSAVDHHMGFVDAVYDPAGSDTYLFAGTALSVEKRLKTDLSLVTTYNLTPSAIDTTLQGFIATIGGGTSNNRVNANGCINASGTFSGSNLPILTRFVAQQGFVLIDTDGTEYPLLAGVSLSQDFYNGGTDANVFSQAVLLWLGTPPGGFDCYTWSGVDAAGLKISDAQTGTRNDAGIGDMRVCGSGIGDNYSVMLPLDAPYTAITFDTDTYAGASCRVRCANFGGRSFVDDRAGLTVGDTFFIDDVLTYAVGGSGTPEPALTVIAGIMAGINAGSVYAASGLGSYVDGITGLTVHTFTLTRLDAAPVTVDFGYTSIWGYRLERRVVSIRLVGGVPVVRLEKLQHKDQPLYMFDI